MRKTTALICCDTSFLFSVYGKDGFTPQAITVLTGLGCALNISILNDFELENSVRMAVFRKLRSPEQANMILSEYAQDINAGRLALAACNLIEVVAEAKRLALAHTWSSAHRSFDILHVAAALHLGAREFLSFDVNQRKLAKAEGLKISPV